MVGDEETRGDLAGLGAPGGDAPTHTTPTGAGGGHAAAGEEGSEEEEEEEEEGADLITALLRRDSEGRFKIKLEGDEYGVFINGIGPSDVADERGRLQVHDYLHSIDGVTADDLSLSAAKEWIKRADEPLELCVLRPREEGGDSGAERATWAADAPASDGGAVAAAAAAAASVGFGGSATPFEATPFEATPFDVSFESAFASLPTEAFGQAMTPAGDGAATATTRATALAPAGEAGEAEAAFEQMRALCAASQQAQHELVACCESYAAEIKSMEVDARRLRAALVAAEEAAATAERNLALDKPSELGQQLQAQARKIQRLQKDVRAGEVALEVLAGEMRESDAPSHRVVSLHELAEQEAAANGAPRDAAPMATTDQASAGRARSAMGSPPRPPSSDPAAALQHARQARERKDADSEATGTPPRPPSSNPAAALQHARQARERKDADLEARLAAAEKALAEAKGENKLLTQLYEVCTPRALGVHVCRCECVRLRARVCVRRECVAHVVRAWVCCARAPSTPCAHLRSCLRQPV